MKLQLRQFYVNRRSGWLCQLEERWKDKEDRLVLRVKIVHQARTIEVYSREFNRDYEMFGSARKIIRCKNRYEKRKQRKRRRREQ